MFAWLVVIGLTGSYLAVSDAVESWAHPHRYHVTDGPDVGLDAVVDTVGTAVGDGTLVTTVTLPNNGRGVYQAWVEVPAPTIPRASRCTASTSSIPGAGAINGMVR